MRDLHWEGILPPLLAHPEPLAGTFIPGLSCPRAKRRPHTTLSSSPQLLSFLGFQNPARSSQARVSAQVTALNVVARGSGLSAVTKESLTQGCPCLCLSQTQLLSALQERRALHPGELLNPPGILPSPFCLALGWLAALGHRELSGHAASPGFTPLAQHGWDVNQELHLYSHEAFHCLPRGNPLLAGGGYRGRHSPAAPGVSVTWKMKK